MSLDDPREPTAPASRRTRTVTPVARALTLAKSLRALLDEERRAAVIAEPTAIEGLAARKRELLASLERLQPELRQLFAEDGRSGGETDAERDELLACLRECRERNAENSVAVGAAIGQARSALSLLRDVLALDDLTLYDERGELQVRRERRRFGRA